MAKVIISVVTADQARESIELKLSVRDTGIGIPEDQQAHIFEAFSQADATTTRKFGGTGLGLAISERLIAMMAERIWVESEIGTGSTFHLVLRLDVSPAPTEPEPDATTHLQDLRILVVDDNATSRRVLGDYLPRWGLRATFAEGDLKRYEL